MRELCTSSFCNEGRRPWVAHTSNSSVCCGQVADWTAVSLRAPGARPQTTAPELWSAEQRVSMCDAPSSPLLEGSLLESPRQHRRGVLAAQTSLPLRSTLVATAPADRLLCLGVSAKLKQLLKTGAKVGKPSMEVTGERSKGRAQIEWNGSKTARERPLPCALNYLCWW